MTIKTKVSVLIMVQNSENTLKRTLESIKNFDDIVIADGGSTDKTSELALQYSENYHLNKFKGFSDQRNFLISKAKHEWCLFLDSDEVVTNELEVEINKIVNQNNNSTLLYRIMRTEYLQSKEIAYGHGSSGTQERFFKKNNVKYVGEVHEYPLVNNEKVENLNSDKIKTIRPSARLHHYPLVTTTIMLNKVAPYSILKAKQKIESNRKTNGFLVILSFLGTFLQIWAKSYKNGKRGFILAVLEAYHRSMVKLLIYEDQMLKDELKK